MNKFALSLSLILVLGTVCLRPTEARGYRAFGPYGAVGAGGGTFAGPKGGTWRAGGARYAGQNSGFGAGAFKGTGPNGGTGQGAGAYGWKRGVGGAEQTGMSLNGAGGSTYNGFTKGGYNAQTGQGAYNASHQVYDAQNGMHYGDTNQTTYSNGKGVTQLDTDNHGDYAIDWSKGQKPTIINDTASQ